MSKLTVNAVVIVVSTLGVQPVLAQGSHGHTKNADSGNTMSVPSSSEIDDGMMAGDMHSMMQKMMAGGMQSMKKMMLGQNMGMIATSVLVDTEHLRRIFDTNKDGKLTPSELSAGFLADLKTYDLDENGTLSLSEFEMLHAAHVREQTVDNFQEFDADGDGQITASEIVVPFEQMGNLIANKN